MHPKPNLKEWKWVQHLPTRWNLMIRSGWNGTCCIPQRQGDYRQQQHIDQILTSWSTSSGKKDSTVAVWNVPMSSFWSLKIELKLSWGRWVQQRGAFLHFTTAIVVLEPVKNIQHTREIVSMHDQKYFLTWKHQCVDKWSLSSSSKEHSTEAQHVTQWIWLRRECRLSVTRSSKVFEVVPWGETITEHFVKPSLNP